MNTIRLLAIPAVALLTLASALPARADDPTPDTSASQVWSQTKTTAQVRQELMLARADGSIKVWSTSYNPSTGFKSIRSRGEVQAEVLASRANEYDRAMYGEDSGSFALSGVRPVGAIGHIVAQAAASSR
jgi:hypothetical protein